MTPAEAALHLSDLPFGPVQQRVVETLLDSFGKWVSTERLLGRVYGDRTDVVP